MPENTPVKEASKDLTEEQRHKLRQEQANLGTEIEKLGNLITANKTEMNAKQKRLKDIKRELAGKK